jgi:hypothetical protein
MSFAERLPAQPRKYLEEGLNLLARSTKEASGRYPGSFIGFYHSGRMLQFYIGCISDL